MVEAAGVEPASERPVATGIYMRIRSCCFAPGIKERRKRRALVREVSPNQFGRLITASLLNGVRSQPVGWKRRTSRGLMPRVQAASSQLQFFVHRFYERDEQARHASSNPLPPSKPYRPHKGELPMSLSF